MTVHLDKLEGIPARIAATAFPNYTGRKFQITTGTTFNPNENNWQGGSRTYMKLVSRTGQLATIPECGNPFSGFAPNSVEIPPQTIVVEHCIFCGKDLGLRFIVRPEEFDTLALPAHVELSKEEKTILVYTVCRKSSYNGQNRFQMYRDDIRIYHNLPTMSSEQWEATKQALASRGLLNKSGAITTAGRNAIGDTREISI